VKENAVVRVSSVQCVSYLEAVRELEGWGINNGSRANKTSEGFSSTEE
jgi:hypothetical protein